MRHYLQAIKPILVLSSLTLIVGCRGISQEVQGEYRDQANGVTLELSAFEGVIRFSDGRVISEDVRVLEFNEIAKGQSGIFTRENTHNKGYTEVFVVRPSAFQNIEGSDLAWAEAEILYTVVNQADLSQLGEITLDHCDVGQVLIDKKEQRFAIGCPSIERTYHLKKERDSYNAPGGGDLIHP